MSWQNRRYLIKMVDFNFKIINLDVLKNFKFRLISILFTYFYLRNVFKVLILFLHLNFNHFTIFFF